MSNIDTLRWKKYPVLNDGFICLVDAMGDDYAIVQAARKSYDKDLHTNDPYLLAAVKKKFPLVEEVYYNDEDKLTCIENNTHKSFSLSGTRDFELLANDIKKEAHSSERNTIRFMMRLGHTSPFEMVELKFLVRVPMDCWRQWIRHRTANVNEYSTRYTEAIDSQQTTLPGEWRLQATDNKQGSSGFLEEKDWPEDFDFEDYNNQPYSDARNYLSWKEKQLHDDAKHIYQERLSFGIAKEQARKDLPLSTYTEAYWKCDLHNIFNFLRLRMDSHAQYEIRMYANAMAEIVKQVVPVAWEAFEDYVLHAKKFSRMEMEVLIEAIEDTKNKIYMADEGKINFRRDFAERLEFTNKPSSMTDREWKEFLGKLS